MPACFNLTNHSYTVQTAIICLKEFTAVLVQLVCFSRLGQVDLFNGALLLYLVLTVFSFPFLNSYLFGFMRFGMWCVGDSSAWFFKTFTQFLVISIFQVLGACAAAEIVKWSKASWEGAVYHSISDRNGTISQIGFVYEEAKGVGVFVLFLEEFFAVLILLIGLLHLIHKFSAHLLINTYWAQETAQKERTIRTKETAEEERIKTKETAAEERIKTKETAAEERANKIETALDNILKQIGEIREEPMHSLVNMTSAADPLLQAPFSAKPSKPFPPVPAELILHASLLVAAVSRAFPSAHQSLHLSAYFWCMGYFGNDFNQVLYRVLGGYVACIVAVAYYLYWYSRAGRANAEKSWTRSILLDARPATMSSALRLPNYMLLKHAV
jgi:hypothetical protein